MHPGAWFLWAAASGLVAATTTNPFYLVPLFGAAFLVHSAHRRPGPQSRSFKIFALFGLLTIVTRTSFVVFGTIELEAVAFAFFEGLRLAVMLAIFGTFNSVCDPFRLLRLAPRRFYEPVLAAALALSMAPRTLDAVTRVREAQRLRGMNVTRWRSWPALAVPVLETGMEDALVLAESMDARGHGRGARSRYRPEPWGRRSTIMTAAAVLSVAIFIDASVTGAGELLVSTYPLRWPGASLLLVATVALAATPALMRDGS